MPHAPVRRPAPLCLPLLAFLLAACAGPAPRAAAPPAPTAAAPPAAAEPGSWQVSPDLQVRELRPGVWLHTSWRPLADGTRFPSNGLVVRDGDGLLLVDTAWGEPLTAELLGWIDDTLRLPVTRAVATHFHDDRLGGAPLLAERGLRMAAHPLTRGLAEGRGAAALPDPLAGLEAPGSAVRFGAAEVFYPGPGHARDNVLVWLPESGVLFGGCAVRSAAARDLGNTADADVAAWPGSIRRALARYGTAARVVVPGHGQPGGPELLEHTVALFPPAAGR